MKRIRGWRIGRRRGDSVKVKEINGYGDTKSTRGSERAFYFIYCFLGRMDGGCYFYL